MKLAAKIISYVFHPLLMPSVSIALVIFYYNPTILSFMSTSQKLSFVGLTWGITFLAPVTFILFLYYKGEINDIYIYEKEKRKLPMMLAAICCGISAYQLNVFMYPKIIVNILMLTTLGIVISYIINLYWKISLHAMGAAALCSIVFTLFPYSYYDYSAILIICIITSGLIGTSRLILNAHTLPQILAGFALGSLAGLII